MMDDITEFYGLILAAGMGKRLRANESDTFPKVLREVNGRPMIAYVLDALRGAGVTDICVVVGVGAEQVRETLGHSLIYAFQEYQRGSGDAAASARPLLIGKSRHVIVMCGDSPLFTAATLAALKAEHLRRGAVVTLVTAEVDDPTGYGRIVRRDGQIVGIVEEELATPEQKAIKEINGGCYAFDSAWLWSNIGRIQPSPPPKNEKCLTDVIQFAVEDGETVAAVFAAPEEILGVNTPEQLREAEEILRERRSS
ncbi:MAG: NTP transferase domain-containing protein [Armatimonadota bacterium]|nr:NTP transferase domain-containing protein [Armatimonadota bacterium]